MNNASIVMAATKYIKDLKKKVENLSEDIASSGCSYEDSCPTVTVNTLGKDFLVRVFSKENCPGLLVWVLEAFEDIGLNVLEARVSCTNNFQLEAIGVGEENEEIMDAQMVKWAVSKAINSWSKSVKEEQE